MNSSSRPQGERAVRVDPGLEEFARSEVSRQLGGGRAISVEALQVGIHHAVLLVTVESSPYPVVLKVAGPDDQRPIDFDRTAAVIALAQAAGVPVPAVVAVDSTYRAGPWRYLMLEHVAGTEWRDVRPLLDDDGVAAAHEQMADALLAIQSVRLGSFGEVDEGLPRPDLLGALRRRADRLITDERARRSFAAVLDRDAGLFVAPEQTSTLSHDDLHHGNLVFRPVRGRWQLVGVLDWDKAWAGPAESDVARMAFWDDMTGPAFWEVYRSAVPMIDGWAERMLIYQLLWCLEFNSTSARHQLDTLRLRRQLRVD